MNRLLLTVSCVLVALVVSAGDCCGLQVYSSWSKARKLVGAWGEGCGYSAEGTCELKCGKANRKGFAKVSLKITPFNGKKRTYRSKAVDVSSGDQVVVNWGDYAVTIDEDGSFFGEPVYGNMRPDCSPDAVWNANVGGEMYGSHYLAIASSWEDWYDNMDPQLQKLLGLEKYDGGMCSYFEDADGMWFSAAGSKWTFLPSEYARTLKMTYKPKTGVFKGKLKVAFGPYCMEAAPGMRLPKGKTATFSVTGYRIDGRLYGNAKYKTFSTSVWGE